MTIYLTHCQPPSKQDDMTGITSLKKFNEALKNPLPITELLQRSGACSSSAQTMINTCIQKLSSSNPENKLCALNKLKKLLDKNKIDDFSPLIACVPHLIEIAKQNLPQNNLHEMSSWPQRLEVMQARIAVATDDLVHNYDSVSLSSEDKTNLKNRDLSIEILNLLLNKNESIDKEIFSFSLNTLKKCSQDFKAFSTKYASYDDLSKEEHVFNRGFFGILDLNHRNLSHTSSLLHLLATTTTSTTPLQKESIETLVDLLKISHHITQELEKNFFELRKNGLYINKELFHRIYELFKVPLINCMTLIALKSKDATTHPHFQSSGIIKWLVENQPSGFNDEFNKVFKMITTNIFTHLSFDPACNLQLRQNKGFNFLFEYLLVKHPPTTEKIASALVYTAKNIESSNSPYFQNESNYFQNMIDFFFTQALEQKEPKLFELLFILSRNPQYNERFQTSLNAHQDNLINALEQSSSPEIKYSLIRLAAQVDCPTSQTLLEKCPSDFDFCSVLAPLTTEGAIHRLLSMVNQKKAPIMFLDNDLIRVKQAESLEEAHASFSDNLVLELTKETEPKSIKKLLKQHQLLHATSQGKTLLDSAIEEYFNCSKNKKEATLENIKWLISKGATRNLDTLALSLKKTLDDQHNLIERFLVDGEYMFNAVCLHKKTETPLDEILSKKILLGIDSCTTYYLLKKDTPIDDSSLIPSNQIQNKPSIKDSKSINITTGKQEGIFSNLPQADELNAHDYKIVETKMEPAFVDKSDLEDYLKPSGEILFPFVLAYGTCEIIDQLPKLIRALEEVGNLINDILSLEDYLPGLDELLPQDTLDALVNHKTAIEAQLEKEEFSKFKPELYEVLSKLNISLTALQKQRVERIALNTQVEKAICECESLIRNERLKRGRRTINHLALIQLKLKNGSNFMIEQKSQFDKALVDCYDFYKAVKEAKDKKAKHMCFTFQKDNKLYKTLDKLNQKLKEKTTLVEKMLEDLHVAIRSAQARRVAIKEAQASSTIQRKYRQHLSEKEKL